MAIYPELCIGQTHIINAKTQDDAIAWLVVNAGTEEAIVDSVSDLPFVHFRIFGVDYQALLQRRSPTEWEATWYEG